MQLFAIQVLLKLDYKFGWRRSLM